MAENEIISSSDMHFFEGVEKLLEIWFAPPNQNSADLRKIPRLVQVFFFLFCWLKRCFEYLVHFVGPKNIYLIKKKITVGCCCYYAVEFFINSGFYILLQQFALSNQKSSRK